MKKMIERLLFLLVGALIAALAYAVGNADRDATAENGTLLEDAAFGKVFCRELSIMDESGVPRIMLRSDNGLAHLSLGSERQGSIILEISKEGVPLLSLNSGEKNRNIILGFQDAGHAELQLNSREGVQGGQIRLATNKDGAAIRLSDSNFDDTPPIPKGVILGTHLEEGTILFLDGDKVVGILQHRDIMKGVEPQ